jgi:hypothetical protein
MVVALEERSTHEVLDQNKAIETLKTEVEVLGAETCLTVEVGGLSTARAEAKNLWKEVESLWKQVEAAKTMDTLAVERASKANKTAENLRKKIDAKKKIILSLAAAG